MVLLLLFLWTLRRNKTGQPYTHSLTECSSGSKFKLQLELSGRPLQDLLCMINHYLRHHDMRGYKRHSRSVWCPHVVVVTVMFGGRMVSNPGSPISFVGGERMPHLCELHELGCAQKGNRTTQQYLTTLLLHPPWCPPFPETQFNKLESLIATAAIGASRRITPMLILFKDVPVCPSKIGPPKYKSESVTRVRTDYRVFLHCWQCAKC